MSNKKSIENWDDFKASVRDDKQEIKGEWNDSMGVFIPAVKQEIKNIIEDIKYWISDKIEEYMEKKSGK